MQDMSPRICFRGAKYEIYQKTVKQSQSQFWFDQRAGRITASSFYSVCHLRESTDIAEDARP